MDNQNQQGGQPTQRISTEEFHVSGDELVGRVKELVKEGNIRNVTIKNEQGEVLLTIPLTMGVVGAAATVIFLPVLAALGALAAIVAKLTIVVERVES